MKVIRRCSIVVGVLQLLLAGLHTWSIVDLSVFGTAIRPSAFAFVATFLAVQVVILVLAWELPRHPRRNMLFLAWTYSVGLVIWGSVSVMVPNITPCVVERGAKLPPNELFGSGWPVAVAWMAFGLAQLLGIIPLCFVLHGLLRNSRATGLPHE